MVIIQRQYNQMTLLNVNDQKGLSSDQVKEKQKEYGRNEAAEKKESSILAFAKKFWA